MPTAFFCDLETIIFDGEKKKTKKKKKLKKKTNLNRRDGE